MRYFDEIFQFSVLAALVAYVFVVGDKQNVDLIIGALIGVLSGIPLKKDKQKEGE